MTPEAVLILTACCLLVIVVLQHVWRCRAERRLVTLLLSHHGDLRGLELVKLSGGLLARGRVYVVLMRMQDAGEVYSYPWRADLLEGAEPRRLVYTLDKPPASG